MRTRPYFWDNTSVYIITYIILCIIHCLRYRYVIRILRLRVCRFYFCLIRYKYSGRSMIKTHLSFYVIKHTTLLQKARALRFCTELAENELVQRNIPAYIYIYSFRRQLYNIMYYNITLQWRAIRYYVKLFKLRFVHPALGLSFYCVDYNRPVLDKLTQRYQEYIIIQLKIAELLGLAG